MRKSDCGVRSGNDRTMEIDEIISALEYHTGRFPRAAVEEAIGKKDRIIPELLKVLETARHDEGRSIQADERYHLHMYAVYLLAQFREKMPGLSNRSGNAINGNSEIRQNRFDGVAGRDGGHSPYSSAF